MMGAVRDGGVVNFALFSRTSSFLRAICISSRVSHVETCLFAVEFSLLSVFVFCNSTLDHNVVFAQKDGQKSER